MMNTELTTLSLCDLSNVTGGTHGRNNTAAENDTVVGNLGVAAGGAARIVSGAATVGHGLGSAATNLITMPNRVGIAMRPALGQAVRDGIGQGRAILGV